MPVDEVRSATNLRAISRAWRVALPMLVTVAGEDTRMSTTWRRIVVGIAVALCLLAIGVLEVMSQRVRVNLALTFPRTSEGVRPEPSWDVLVSPPDVLRPEGDQLADDGAGPAGGLARAGQAGRLVVLEVNEKDRRLTSVNGSGRVLTTEVSQEAAPALTHLKKGDGIKVEPPRGQAQRIVVLCQAWEEMTSPEH